jgi:xanthine dehydrogenase small subunit
VLGSDPANSNKEDNGAIRFYLNGQLREVGSLEPTTTVLNYLREELLQCGTKEGCAEGDCGACTVVMAEAHQGRIRFRSINACIQFLPTLDGKALFTVEGLRNPDQSLHPVQQAMVDCHASQCGFCTPGFVMSLFALYKSQDRPDRDDIDDALAGNLCRCTGYRPIISAATRMYEYGQALDEDQQNLISQAKCDIANNTTLSEEQDLLDKLDAIKPESDLCLQDKYFAPTSATSVASLLEIYPEANILAGGTDVGLWVTKQHRELPVIVYLGQVEELKSLRIDDAYISISANVSLSDAFAALWHYFPDLYEIARRFASPPIRNAGTLVGNVANGSPIGDSMPALICLGTIVVIRSATGSREVALDKFYLGYQQKDLQAGEFVEAIRVPLPETKQYFRSYKISKRFDQDISAVAAAYRLHLVDDKVKEIDICYGGMAATPLRAHSCEQALLGEPWEISSIEVAIEALASDFTPLTDMRASADYRSRVAANLLLRFYHEVNGVDQQSTHVLRYEG